MRVSLHMMGRIKLHGFVVLLVVSESLAGLNVLSAVSNLTTRPLANIFTNTKDFMQIAAENGYNAEKHEVITTDGYVLTMFRIPPRNNCTKKPPMLLMHGLLQSSEGFVASGPEAPAFVLAGEGYDIWVGNVRGSQHSRQHMTLNPEEDLAFWKFSVDEIGRYDIPGMVDCVLKATGAKKLIYIGYSQGAGTFFIMNSERPEYADKICLLIGLGPALRHYYTRSVAVRKAMVAVNSMRTQLEAAGVWEVLAKGFPFQGTLSILCQEELLAAVVCGLTLAVVDSPHPDSVTPDIQRRVFETGPVGTSVQNFARYGQAMNEVKFVKFDYGSKGNLEVYGSAEPPEYDLGASTMPVVFFSGKADHVVDLRDVAWAKKQLPNVLDSIIVGEPKWNHIDMTYSRYWRDSIFNKMKKYLDICDDINICYGNNATALLP